MKYRIKEKWNPQTTFNQHFVALIINSKLQIFTFWFLNIVLISKYAQWQPSTGGSPAMAVWRQWCKSFRHQPTIWSYSEQWSVTTSASHYLPQGRAPCSASLLSCPRLHFSNQPEGRDPVETLKSKQGSFSDEKYSELFGATVKPEPRGEGTFVQFSNMRHLEANGSDPATLLTPLLTIFLWEHYDHQLLVYWKLQLKAWGELEMHHYDPKRWNALPADLWKGLKIQGFN